MRSKQQDEGGPLGELVFTDPDLADLVAAWPTLSEPIRAAIKMLVSSAENKAANAPK